MSEENTREALESALQEMFGHLPERRQRELESSLKLIRWSVRGFSLGPFYLCLLSFASALCGSVPLGIAHALTALAMAFGLGMYESRSRLAAYRRAIIFPVPE